MKADENQKRDFVALAVHKLKTPISSIKLSLEMLLEGDFGELSLEERKVIERIHQRNEVLIYLVNDLLNLAQIGNKYPLSLVPVNFKRLVKLVINTDEEEMQKKAISIRFEDKAVISDVIADKEKMFLAVQNIFDNAVKYSNVGGEIIVVLESDTESIRLKIQDFGIGIIDSDKEKLFTEFFRGKNAKEAQLMGSGLGLFIAKDIIEKHGGRIWFESKEGRGTTFFVVIPINGELRQK